MLDIKRIRSSADEVESLLKRKSPKISLDRVLKMDGELRRLSVSAEAMKQEHNIRSKRVAAMRSEGMDMDPVLKDLRRMSDDISEMYKRIKELKDSIEAELMGIPNTPDACVPQGETDADNVELRRWGNVPDFGFEPCSHWHLGRKLCILDSERASKLSGARFPLFVGSGARLERALIQFMLDVHTQDHGFTEVSPPLMANGASMSGTGQLPKFRDDMFRIEGRDYYMIPTAEVPLTNMYMGEVLKEMELPVRMTAYTPCFRREIGAAGRDTRGLIRNHQFDKVEMVMYALPEKSDEALQWLTSCAEDILKQLRLPYRVVELCTKDLGFSAARTYDLEVWMPSYGRYVEISSCSNMRDYQARRIDLRYKPASGGRPRLLHTLNGSGLAVGRTFAALIENFQKAEGTVEIPEVLRKYMGGMKSIS